MHGRREEVERLIYEFVNEYAEQNNVYPSYREIAKGIGSSCASNVISLYQAHGRERKIRN